AGADYVRPAALAALGARHGVVEAEIGGGELAAAVLAAVVVARKDIASLELRGLARQLVVPEQSDDAWHLNFEVHGAHPIVVGPLEPRAELAHLTPALEVVRRELTVLDVHDLRQLLEEQAEGTPRRDDVDRHEEPVENQ